MATTEQIELLWGVKFPLDKKSLRLGPATYFSVFRRQNARLGGVKATMGRNGLSVRFGDADETRHLSSFGQKSKKGRKLLPHSGTIRRGCGIPWPSPD